MRLLNALALLIGLTVSGIGYSQTKPDSLGLPGDNFDLYAALDLFKKAESPEAFEKAINAKDNEINNLDLDGDGKVDYIKVTDKQQKDGHALVMQVAVSESEIQDVAVIEVEKTGDDKAHVQIVGNEELYGKDYIIEPKEETTSTTNQKVKQQGSTDDVYATSDDSNRNTNSTDNSQANSNNNSNVVVNVWAWPSVRYMYAPGYTMWVSPWYWNYYPGWWDPWSPIYWRYYHRRVYHYHRPFYHRAHFYRSPGIHGYYYGMRASSGTVRRNHESGLYRNRQAEYRKNPQPGRRYNNQPARRNTEIKRQSVEQPGRISSPDRRNNGTGGTRPTRSNTQPSRNGNIQKQPSSTPRINQQPQRQQNGGVRSAPQRQGGGNGGGSRQGSGGGGSRHR